GRRRHTRFSRDWSSDVCSSDLLAQQRYQEGVDNYLAVLDAQRELFSAQQQLLSDRLLQLNSEVQLYKALGGGWESGIAGRDQTPQKPERPGCRLAPLGPPFR